MPQYEAQLRPYESLLPYKRVEFKTFDGTILRGNFYFGANIQGRKPIVVFCHGLGLVKEQYLENWFRHVVASGYHVLAYDNRSFGNSDGLPRGNFDWYGQTEDMIDAVTFVRSLPEVDEDKVFCWGVAHAGGLIAMAAAMDRRVSGIVLFLPCIDGAWDKSRWGDWIWESAQRSRFQQHSLDPQSVRFWPLTDDEAAGKAGSVLSGDYVREWSAVGQKMAEQGGNTFDGRVTVRSFWNDFNCRPLDYFDRIAPTPLLWVMATDDVVCGPLEWTKSEYEKLKGPKEICILEGEHLPQYFDPGFGKSVEAMLCFLQRYSK